MEQKRSSIKSNLLLAVSASSSNSFLEACQSKMAEKRKRVDDDGGKKEEDLRTLIPELCNQFYHLGWMSGTGGAMSIREGPNRLLVTPSGVQKERIKLDQLFVCDDDGNIIEGPDPSEGIKMSSCATFFLLAHKQKGAGACMHNHSKAAFMASVVFPGKEIKLTHMQLIRGIKNDKTGKNYDFDDELVIPVIENTLKEITLVEPLAQAMKEYPEASCVLVRRHGIYLWAETWQRAKIMCECLDYIFEMAVQMKLHGIDPSQKPDKGH